MTNWRWAEVHQSSIPLNEARLVFQEEDLESLTARAAPLGTSANLAALGAAEPELDLDVEWRRVQDSDGLEIVGDSAARQY